MATTQRVNQQTFSRLSTSRAKSFKYLRDRFNAGEITTGLLYIDDSRKEMHDLMGNVDLPEANRAVLVGTNTFGKGTVQSLLDLDDYVSSDRRGLGQLKITMAQFFRVNGGSTQNRGVVPDIRFPSAGDPDDYGERSMDNALPWTQIDAARYDAAGDMSQLVAVADNRYQGRIVLVLCKNVTGG